MIFLPLVLCWKSVLKITALWEECVKVEFTPPLLDYELNEAGSLNVRVVGGLSRKV